MSKRKLRRQIGLVQLIMLGTSGAIAAEIFVLTGHAAAMVGPAMVLALAVAGVLNASIGLNYCELATMYPVTGGGVTYVREAWGNGILAFLVGSMDCLSSAFYAALSALGFAYSMQVFVPSLPVVPTAIAAILVFVVLNVFGVTKVGNAQMVLGAILLFCLGAYVIVGLLSPHGFQWTTFVGDSFFIHRGLTANLVKTLNTIALIYAAYVGFEIIAHDAEEAINPSRNIPLAIMISVSLCMVIYVLTGLVTLGTVSWREIAGSETALTDVVVRFMPRWGVPMMGLAGIIATLTTVNGSLLSGTREAFSLGRGGVWPRVFSAVSRYRTPHVACWAIGAVTCLVAALGVVDLLSYISSSGLLFVLFFSNLALIRLRKLHPDMPRPFKVPLYPLTPVLAILTCVLVISFSSVQALLFGAGVLAICTLLYYLNGPVTRFVAQRIKAAEPERDRILVPVANPNTARGLCQTAVTLALASEDTTICLLTVLPSGRHLPLLSSERLLSRVTAGKQVLLREVANEAQQANVPVYTKVRTAEQVSNGIVEELESHSGYKLVLMGWPGPLQPEQIPNHPVKVVLQKGRAHVAVLLNRGLEQVQRILVPVGGGFHSRLAIRLAYEIGLPHHAEITFLHVLCSQCDPEELEDNMTHLREIVEESLGSMPSQMATRLVRADDVLQGVLKEAERVPYDLMVIGASDEWLLRTALFGDLTDEIAGQIKCSVLLARRYEAAAISWIRHQAKRVEHDEPGH